MSGPWSTVRLFWAYLWSPRLDWEEFQQFAPRFRDPYAAWAAALRVQDAWYFKPFPWLAREGRAWNRALVRQVLRREGAGVAEVLAANPGLPPEGVEEILHWLQQPVRAFRLRQVLGRGEGLPSERARQVDWLAMGSPVFALLVQRGLVPLEHRAMRQMRALFQKNPEVAGYRSAVLAHREMPPEEVEAVIDRLSQEARVEVLEMLCRRGGAECFLRHWPELSHHSPVVALRLMAEFPEHRGAVPARHWMPLFQHPNPALRLAAFRLFPCGGAPERDAGSAALPSSPR